MRRLGSAQGRKQEPVTTAAAVDGTTAGASSGAAEGGDGLLTYTLFAPASRSREASQQPAQGGGSAAAEMRMLTSS